MGIPNTRYGRCQILITPTSPLPSSLPSLLRSDLIRKVRYCYEQILHKPVVGHLEDGSLGILVDGHDGLGVLHPRQVLDGARDPNGNVEVRGHDLAGLADLQVVG